MQPLIPYQVTPKSTQQLLSECVENAIDKDSNEFAWDSFFRMWFREYGIPCYFLFKRHLGVTNTQYVELLSLLQLHTCANDEKQKKHLLFHTTEHVKATVEEAVSVLLESHETNRKLQTERFAATYADVFASTVAVDVFYCSCAIFLPPGLRVDLEHICADAGYLHSAGRSIFVRNIRKARHKELDDSIEKYLSSMTSSDLPIPFVVYAHEDFSAYDRDSREQINRGIENTKLHCCPKQHSLYGLSC